MASIEKDQSHDPKIDQGKPRGVQSEYDVAARKLRRDTRNVGSLMFDDLTGGLLTLRLAGALEEEEKSMQRLSHEPGSAPQEPRRRLSIHTLFRGRRTR